MSLAMKTTYAQNNTRSLLFIIGSIVLALVLIAALMGLSEKPDITAVAISTSGASGSAGPAVSFDDQAAAQSNDEQAAPAANTTATLQPIPLDDEADPGLATSPQPTAVTTGTTSTTTANAAPAPVPIPTIAPTPTPTEVPEIAAAVEPLPTSLPATQASATDGTDTAAVTSAAATTATVNSAPSGTLTGNFFTRPDEEEGATVARNEVELTFDEAGGGGSFRGVLDITYADGSQVQIDMTGPFIYSPASPQVMASVDGTYRRDAVDDLDDVSTERGDLSITSFVSGTGALCTPTCFGFTFPPPGGS